MSPSSASRPPNAALHAHSEVSVEITETRGHNHRGDTLDFALSSLFRLPAAELVT